MRYLALILVSTLAACGGNSEPPTVQERAEALARDEHVTVLEVIKRHPELFVLTMCGDSPCAGRAIDWGVGDGWWTAPIDSGYGGTGSTSWDSVPVTRKDVSPVDGGGGTQ
jgi:hypothetical protein